MLLSQVTLKTMNHGQERHIWFAFESEHDTLKAIHDALKDSGVVYGQKVETEQLTSGSRRAVRRQECILTKEALVSITPLQFELVERGAGQ